MHFSIVLIGCGGNSCTASKNRKSLLDCIHTTHLCVKWWKKRKKNVERDVHFDKVDLRCDFRQWSVFFFEQRKKKRLAVPVNALECYKWYCVLHWNTNTTITTTTLNFGCKIIQAHKWNTNKDLFINRSNELQWLERIHIRMSIDCHSYKKTQIHLNIMSLSSSSTKPITSKMKFDDVSF